MADSKISFSVNEDSLSVTVDPKMSLAHVLRNVLGLRGTRLGCEQGNCGACTVTVGGRAVQSCDITVEAVAGQEVVTIDHLARHDPPHPLVGALLDADAGQCSFCLAGIVMSALPLYGRADGRDELVPALGRNLCRCGAHRRILDALGRALDEAAP